MKFVKKYLSLVILGMIVTGIVVFGSLYSNAQGPGQAPDGERGIRGEGRGNFNPAEMRERMSERVKTELGVTDEEWTAIKPLVEKVVEKQRTVRDFSGRGGFMGMRGRGPGGEQGGFPGESIPEIDALRKALDSPEASAEDIKLKLDNYRKARQTAEVNLKTAREELRAVLVLKQEAKLVLMGLLD
jgi:hypothetical protein